MIRRLHAAAAAVVLAIAPTVAVAAQERMTPEEAFVAELAVIRGMPVEQLDYAGAVAVGQNTCWTLTHPHGAGFHNTERWDTGTEVAIRDAAVRWICPEVAR